ncbi:MAG: ECF transporter S component [Bacilli bacterium]|nr:ECF transporter S component [Bacilli bacterium]MDY6141861.1 ECF transporter S component [Bacilli bacterium]
MHNASKKVLYNMVIIALFTALTFVGTYVQIPLGTSKVHLGNFVCILAGLLCGGLVGGISGSLGMGLNDLLSGYGPDTYIRSFIVKFLLGFIAGALFRYLIKKEKKITYRFYFISGAFLITFITLLVLYLTKGEVIQMDVKRKFTISILLLSLLAVMSVFFFVIQLFVKKINLVQRYVLYVASMASIANITLEFLIKIPFKVWMASLTWEGATIYAVSSLPSSLITCIVTTLFVTFIYIPLYTATQKINRLNDVYENIQKITSLESENKEDVVNEQE